MPYHHHEELPGSVRNSLPEDAQDIFMSAYNSAWEEYKNPDDRRGNNSREDVARKVAWAAVKRKYKKVKQGKWEKK